MTFDVSKYEICDSSRLWLKDYTLQQELLGEDGKPVYVDCHSPGSKEGVKALHAAGRQSQMRQWRMMREQPDPNDAVKADEEHAQKLAGFTIKFSENFPLEPLAIYRNAKLGYIAVQVAEWVSKYGNFPPGSSPT
jgi:hypothetical protein